MLTSRSLFRSTLPVFALCAVIGATAPAAHAQDAHHMAVGADQLTWNPGPPTLPPGAQMAVLRGSPVQEGPFVMRLKFPAGFEIPPHRHPREEHITVISGAFGLGTGDKLDRDAAPLQAVGSFISVAAGYAHFAWTDRETVVQLNGIGPFGVEYVDPADDPRQPAATR